jgi:AraC-like DNA-binding protein
MSFEHVFNELEIDAEPFALCELQGRCELGLGRRSGATLHYILAGRGEILVHGRPPIGVERGTLVLVPSLHSHTLRSFGDPGHPIPDCHPAELDLVRHLQSSEQADTSGKLLAICSDVKVGLRGVGGLVDLVREPIVEQVASDSPMSAPVDRLLQELSAPTLGSRAMIRALLLQCIIQLLRTRLQARDPALNWMAALIDERLWSALRLMLDRPSHPHSLESLADVAGMSRSSFAARFSEAYGSGPMKLLRDLRMHLAASLLTQSELPVKRIAELAGFHSRSAFTRTFESTTGMSPRSFRAGARNK